MGGAALPALREAACGEDPEARACATNLVRRIEGHVPPPGPYPQRKFNERYKAVTTSIVQGTKTVDVHDNGQNIHIIAHADGAIEMSVTGLEDGKEAIETYKAKDAAGLKRDDPEVFKLYENWTRFGPGTEVFEGGLLGGNIRLGPGTPADAPPAPRVAPGGRGVGHTFG